jgi:hypothetical protein
VRHALALLIRLAAAGIAGVVAFAEYTWWAPRHIITASPAFVGVLALLVVILLIGASLAIDT